MNWQPLSGHHFEQLERNREQLQALRPDFYRELGDLRPFAAGLECWMDGDVIRGVRSHPAGQIRLLFPPGNGAALVEEQRRTLETQCARGARFLVVSGIGIGQVMEALLDQVNRYPRAAAAVLEPDPHAWAAYFALGNAQAALRDERLLWFGGNDPRERLKAYLLEQYLFLLPAQNIQYLLGALPADPAVSRAYVEQAQAAARGIQQMAADYAPVIEGCIQRLRMPRRTAPCSIWCCVDKNSYIHFPLARAVLHGFQELGLRAHMNGMDASFGSALRILGNHFETVPDLYFGLNLWPGSVLADLGLSPAIVRAIQRPRACWMVDDITLYEDQGPLVELDEWDWTFCIDRTYLPRARRQGGHAAFLPPAAMVAGPGKVREPFLAPLSYVGSLPDVDGYLQRLPPACREMLERLDPLRQAEHRRSFQELLHSLEPAPDQWNRIRETARAFCASTPKGYTGSAAMLEYFLYNAATYFKRKKTVLALLPLGLKVFGPASWRAALPDPYSHRYGGFAASEDLADAYASARLSLNLHSHQCPTCLNPRDFDVPMAGGVVLGDWVEDADRGLLEPGREMLVYRTVEEAADLARRYLADPAALEALRRQGQERVRRDHTYARRARDMLAMMGYNKSS
ncbi:MAG: glycosyltransferase [bacterium]